VAPEKQRPNTWAWADTEVAAAELVAAAQAESIDLATACSHSQFLVGGRYLHLWRREGIYGYKIQGTIGVLPACLKGSESAFRGMWFEAGQFPDLVHALAFTRAWLLDGVEVDQLPARVVHRYQI
jgi:hypothetical protein